jgi:hypothetical protein
MSGLPDPTTNFIFPRSTFMKNSLRLQRTAADLPQSVHQRLNMYAVAASAAGVGMLAVAPPSEAKIVYTAAHISITPNHTILLDLNHDRTTDFSFRNVLSTTSVGSFRSDRLSIFPRGANQIWGHKTGAGGHYASALAAGIKVGPSGAFSAGSRSMAYGRDDVGSYYCEGKWNGAQKRYLGLKFTIQGKTHFGWARLNVTCNLYKVNAVLTGYAFETMANKAIVTGKTKGPEEVVERSDAALTAPTSKPSGLGLLAMGAAGLSIWRREQ